MSDELKVAVLAKLTKQRERDDRRDNGNIRGISEIAGWLKADKHAVRATLHSLADNGLIERLECSNGIFWRGLPQHNWHVERRLYAIWAGWTTVSGDAPALVGEGRL